MQVSSSGQIYNGTGTQVTNLVLTSVTASFNGLINSASTAVAANTATSASYALTASYALSAAIDISNLATTGSNTFIGNQNVTGNVSVTGTLTANTYILSSSVTSMTIEFASGSTAFGNTSDDTHTFIGSVTVTGSFLVSGSSTFRNIGPAEFTGSVISTQGFTGSLQGTATSASYAVNSDSLNGVAASNYALNTSITGFATTSSLTSYALSTAITGFATTSSLASASVATASYIDPTFISASAAASGFGSGTGGGSGTVNSGAANKLAYYPSAATTVDDTANLEYDGTNLKLLSTAQLDFYTDAGSIYFGSFGSPSNNRVGFSVPGAAVMVIDYTNVRAGFGGTTNLITTAPAGLVEIQGKADEVQLLVKGHSTQTRNIIEVQKSGGSPKFLTLNNSGLVAITGSLGVTGGITGSLYGTATTASYIDPSALVTSIGTAITSTTDTDSLASNTFYTVDSTSGAITISLKANTVGAEFTFFATNLTNNITFAASGSTIVSEDSYLKMNKVGSAVTAKYYTTSSVALIGSLKA
jgi:hypothetical protein